MHGVFSRKVSEHLPAPRAVRAMYGSTPPHGPPFFLILGFKIPYDHGRASGQNLEEAGPRDWPPGRPSRTGPRPQGRHVEFERNGYFRLGV